MPYTFTTEKRKNKILENGKNNEIIKFKAMESKHCGEKQDHQCVCLREKVSSQSDRYL